MKNLELGTLTPKKLRNLRMNLNNRLQSFASSDKPKELQKSHMLFGLGEDECLQLLKAVRKTEKENGAPAE